jgi:AdoMet-dependent rRNA methyltransferase SPB1
VLVRPCEFESCGLTSRVHEPPADYTITANLFSKLVHLNRKYDLLAKSRVVIDLCAAPGGWLQVAQKYCPQQSLIVGVDLDAIRPIPGVHTFVGDITTQACRTSLKGYLKHFQADLVLHDGAPNVGTAWIQDAFTQSELTLQSLKLATEFLKKGGAFVTVATTTR